MGTLGEPPSFLWFCFRPTSTIDCCWRSILHRVPQGDLEEPPLFVPLKFPPVFITYIRMVNSGWSVSVGLLLLSLEVEGSTVTSWGTGDSRGPVENCNDWMHQSELH